MRFIDVTRYGGVKALRLSAAAIAYVDACEGGAVIRLLGGESLRVNEDPAVIESRCILPLVVGIDVSEERVTAQTRPTEASPPKAPVIRKGKRK